MADWFVNIEIIWDKLKIHWNKWIFTGHFIGFKRGIFVPVKYPNLATLSLCLFYTGLYISNADI